MRLAAALAGVAGVAVSLVCAASVFADVTFDFQSAATTASVQRTTDPAVSVTLFQRLDTNCGEACSSYFEVRSPQLIALTAGSAGCAQPPSISDRSAYRCGRLPLMTLVTLGPGADAVQSIGSQGSSGGALCPDPPINVQGAGGPDQLTGGCGADRLDGGDGDDALRAGDGANRLLGGPGSDTLSAGGGQDVLDGGDGLDVVDGGAGDDALTGGGGKDTLTGGAGNDQLDGGDDGDVLVAGAGNDTLRGGDRRDVLVPGTGRDVVEGGPGTDSVLYDERGAGVTVTLDANADDGEAGEGDRVAPDVEDIVASPASDRLVGSDGANDIDAGPGDDSIDPRGGVDSVQAGPGKDTIFALDGVQDRIDCGDGDDTATIDALDTADGCEHLTVSRELMADVDNDGVAAPLDCDDHDPSRRPGLADIPENGRDEDCIAQDALFPRVLATLGANFARKRNRARVTQMVANDVPDSATIEIRCRGGGCFKNARRLSFPNGKRRENLTRRVRKLRLRRRAVLEVRILREGTIGRVFQYRVGKKARVTPAVRCLRPGASSPSACRRQ